jgi:hypothetical protein
MAGKKGKGKGKGHKGGKGKGGKGKTPSQKYHDGMINRAEYEKMIAHKTVAKKMPKKHGKSKERKAASKILGKNIK